MNRSRSVPAAFALALALALAAPTVHAQDFVPVPVGDTLVLRQTEILPDNNIVDFFDPSFAARPGGGFLAGWLHRFDFGVPDRIEVQAFNRLDREVGPTRQVSVDTEPPPDSERALALASSGGRAVAVWLRGEDGEFQVRLRFLNSAGQPTSDTVTVATTPIGRQPAVALSPSGLALVVWSEGAFIDADLVGRIFDSQGNPVTGEIDLDGGFDVDGSAAAGVDGEDRFLVTWSGGTSSPAQRVYTHWIGAAGQTLVAPAPIAGPPAHMPGAWVAPDGRAVVAWTACDDLGPDREDPCPAFFRLLSEDGTPDGPAVRVSPLDGRAHEDPAVGMADGGDFAVAWRACQLNPVGARFDCRVTTSFHGPDGTRHGNRLQKEADGEPTRFTVVPLDDDFVVGWFRFSCDAVDCFPGFESVYAQRYRLVETGGAAGDTEGLSPEIPEGAPVLTSPDFPDFRFYVRIGRPGSDLFGVQEPSCLPETICVSGALPGRTEVQLRVIGPRPNGFLWPTIVKFTTSTVEVWIEQVSTGEVEYYGLDGATQGSSELPGLFDRTGFLP